MRRYSREALAKDPSLRRHDQEATQRASEFFKERPTSVLNFMEGTRFTPEKHSYQQSKYRNLLMPKTGGFGYVVAALGERVASGARRHNRLSEWRTVVLGVHLGTMP